MFFAPQSETMDGGAFANGRMDAPLSDKEQKMRLFPSHCTKSATSVTSTILTYCRIVCNKLALTIRRARGKIYNARSGCVGFFQPDISVSVFIDMYIVILCITIDKVEKHRIVGGVFIFLCLGGTGVGHFVDLLGRP